MRHIFDLKYYCYLKFVVALRFLANKTKIPGRCTENIYAGKMECLGKGIQEKKGDIE